MGNYLAIKFGSASCMRILAVASKSNDVALGDVMNSMEEVL